MKNKRLVWLLAVMSLAGCKGNNNSVNLGDGTPRPDDIVKTDTALVLGKTHSSYHHSDANSALLADKNGNVKEIADWWHTWSVESNLLRYVNVGDTVIVAFDKKKPYIIKNLTMENKIRAFSR